MTSLPVHEENPPRQWGLCVLSLHTTRTPTHKTLSHLVERGSASSCDGRHWGQEADQTWHGPLGLALASGSGLLPHAHSSLLGSGHLPLREPHANPASAGPLCPTSPLA